jgi:hypothetical protein
MRRTLTLIIASFAFAAPAQASQHWIALPQHHHATRHHQAKFKSHYCQTTASPYTGGQTATVCCVWAPYWKDIPDGDGVWNCTIATNPLGPEQVARADLRYHAKPV